MCKAKYYSPRLERDLIPVLYREGKARNVPMTVLASELIRAAHPPPGKWHDVGSANADYFQRRRRFLRAN